MNKKILVCIIIVLMIIIGGILGIIFVTNMHLSDSVINIYSDNQLIKTITLNKDDDYSFTISNKNNNYNTILVKDGYISVSSADCPDKICVHTAPISDGIVPIVCVPNKLIIKSEAK